MRPGPPAPLAGGAAHERCYPRHDCAHIDDVAVLQGGIGVADGQYALEVVAQLLVAQLPLDRIGLKERDGVGDAHLLAVLDERDAVGGQEVGACSLEGLGWEALEGGSYAVVVVVLVEARLQEVRPIVGVIGRGIDSQAVGVVGTLSGDDVLV